jgi:hypothetical protein
MLKNVIPYLLDLKLIKFWASLGSASLTIISVIRLLWQATSLRLNKSHSDDHVQQVSPLAHHLCSRK